MADLQNIAEKLSELTIMEAAELAKMLEEKWGVSAAAPAALAPAVAEKIEQEEQEKDSFNVVLTSFGAQKIAVIKEVRVITGLGLKQAKDLVEAAPSDLKENVDKKEAEEIKEKIEKAGGKVELK